MSVVEIVIFIVGLLFSILAHCVAWAIHTSVKRVLERLKDCDENIKAASKLLDYSAITGSVLQLSADQLRFDPDVNEFERDVALLMLKDPQLTYTGETMNRPNKPKTTTVPLTKPEPKVKPQQVKSDPEQPPPPPPPASEKEPKPVEVKKEIHAPDEQEGENVGKKKFKPPPNITKADAKDPQYETLRGIGNELFAGDNNKKEEEIKGGEGQTPPKKESMVQKKKFKEPPKIQKADAKDPQYETLADVKDDIFKG